MSMHTFDTQIALRTSIPAALIYNHLEFWCRHNRDHQMNYRDGRYWAYITLDEMLKQFDYLGRDTIRRAIRKLREAGLVLTANYNKCHYDRTTWYSVVPLSELDDAVSTSGFATDECAEPTVEDADAEPCDDGVLNPGPADEDDAARKIPAGMAESDPFEAAETPVEGGETRACEGGVSEPPIPDNKKDINKKDISTYVRTAETDAFLLEFKSRLAVQIAEEQENELIRYHHLLGEGFMKRALNIVVQLTRPNRVDYFFQMCMNHERKC